MTYQAPDEIATKGGTDKDRLANEKMCARVTSPEIVDRKSAVGDLRARMLANVTVVETGCMEWLGTVNNLGYGMVSFQKAPGKANRTSTTAHRKFYELTHGELPAGVQVNHKCDNRRCINPDHMFIGTQTDNIRDMMAKGRALRYLLATRRAARHLPPLLA